MSTRLGVLLSNASFPSNELEMILYDQVFSVVEYEM